MSVSAPFITLSVQVAVAHLPAVQTPLRQSPTTLHAFVSGHLAQVPPPQSMSVSAPFITLSVQVGFMHFWPLPQTPEVQSPAPAHPLPSPHFGHAFPPQSTSVSSWFFVLSLHVGRGASGVSMSGMSLSGTTLSGSAPSPTSAAGPSGFTMSSRISSTPLSFARTHVLDRQTSPEVHVPFSKHGSPSPPLLSSEKQPASEINAVIAR